MKNRKVGFSTKAIHYGHEASEHLGSLTPPLFQTSTFVFDNVAQGKNRFSGEEEGYIYTRIGNPTVTVLEERIAALENGEAAVAFSSGMAAVSGVIFGLLKSGDHIISCDALYGGTYSFFEMLKDYQIEYTGLDITDPTDIRKHIKKNTKAIYIETPINPTMKLIDIAAVAKIAKEIGAYLIVDNTFLSPYLQKPLDLGADVVLHSATKYIGGHGDVIAGLTVSNKEIAKQIRMRALKNVGGVMSPFDAWLLLRGIKTLGIRMDRTIENTMKIASYLEGHPKVEKVYYPGLKSFPQYELANRQMNGPGGILSFEVAGGVEAGITVMNSVEIFQLAVSLGDVDSLIQHPASMTHSALPQEERVKVGITDGLIRVSVGIEDVDDLIQDLEQALAKL